jgi:hypothetical protein
MSAQDLKDAAEEADWIRKPLTMNRRERRRYGIKQSSIALQQRLEQCARSTKS